MILRASQVILLGISQVILLGIYLCQISCTTIELPASYSAEGEWQRPLDLHLKTEDESTPEKEGSLQGLKLKVVCGEWTTDPSHFRMEYDNTCISLEKKFGKFEATVLDDDENLEGNEEGKIESPDLIVRYLRGPTESIGCGMYGWISYMTFWLIPCKGYEWGEARLQFLNRDGVILEQYPLKFRRRTLFGWYSLSIKDQALESQQQARIQMVKYIINRTYSIAAKKKMILVSR
jgi:hypothetical protein